MAVEVQGATAFPSASPADTLSAGVAEYARRELEKRSILIPLEPGGPCLQKAFDPLRRQLTLRFSVVLAEVPTDPNLAAASINLASTYPNSDAALGFPVRIVFCANDQRLLSCLRQELVRYFGDFVAATIEDVKKKIRNQQK